MTHWSVNGKSCSHSKHEILPGSRMWKVNCTHFQSTALACHFLRLSDLPYSLYSVRVATHLSQCSWTGTAVCWQIQPHFFTTAQHAVIHPAELTVWPHVFTSCRRHCWQTDTHLHTGTPTHTDKRANRPPTAPPHQQNPVKCWASPRQDEIEITLTVHAILSQVQCICLCDGGQQATA